MVYITKLLTNNTTGRFESTFAAPILATAELINAAWGFDIDLDSIKGYLLEYLSEKVQAVDLSKKRFDLIVEICLRNTVRFYARHDIYLPEPTYEKDIWGIIDALSEVTFTGTAEAESKPVLPPMDDSSSMTN